MKNLFDNTDQSNKLRVPPESHATKRSCSLGLEFLLKNGTPKALTSASVPSFPEERDLQVNLVDYAGNEDDILPSSKQEQWLDKQLNHTLPRCSDLDKIVVLFHCKNFPIACTVQCMLNGSASVNEFSARYAELPNAQITTNTLQDMFPGDNGVTTVSQAIDDKYKERYSNYKELVDMGVTKELSRSILPTSQSTEFYTKLTLFNLIKFIQIYDHSDYPLMTPIITQMKIIFQLGFPKIYSLVNGGKLTPNEKGWEQFVTNYSSSSKNTTYRKNAEKVEALFGSKQIILNQDGSPLDGDKSWIKVTDYSGTEYTPYDAVGMSFGVESSEVQTVESLLQLLISLGHGSPFELPTLFYESRVPFFIFRHLIRHRTMGIHQWSFADDMFVPQARLETSQPVPQDAQRKLESFALASYNETKAIRSTLKNREIEQLVYPTSQYVEFGGRIDIHNMVHFLHLRANPATQYETRLFAYTLQEIFEKWVPAIYKAFVDNKRVTETPRQIPNAA
ncbi:MAG: FAD-dependent thymidylate synthase [Holosporales bacterium]|jgi:thymidylate synthase (FAD)|nr:FAD-dependent thymidylate synthase [Holosporales bacterium]